MTTETTHPATHDPIAVTTKDGTSWFRRAVTNEGRGLYAVDGACSCPEYLMATLAELAEHGVSGTAYALPVPVGTQALDAEARVAELETAAYGAATVRLHPPVEQIRHLHDAVAAQLNRANTLDAICRRQQQRIAELEAERHTTNEALSDAAETLRADRDHMPTPEAEPAEDTYTAALPWAALMDHEDLTEFLNELAESAITHASSERALTEVEDTCGRWRLIAEAQHAHNTAPGPHGDAR